MNKCIVCNKYAPTYDRYFVMPAHILVPNCYPVCYEHLAMQFRYEDFYNEDGTRKPFTKGESHE